MKQEKRPAKPDHDVALYERIRELVLTARQTIARGVDLVQVWTNFEIGRHIVEHEQQGETRAGYGKEVVKNLAERLGSEFGQGFSLSNLKLMRQFYLQFQDRTDRISQAESGQFSKAKSQTASGQFPQSIELSLLPEKRPFSLSWSHYKLHHRHCPVQEKARGTGGNHPAQRCQHPRAGIPALPAQQRRATAQVAGMDRGRRG